MVSPRQQHYPYSLEPQKYGTDLQQPFAVDMLRKLKNKEIIHIQKIVQSILYCARTVDMTVLMALSKIACK